MELLGLWWNLNNYNGYDNQPTESSFRMGFNRSALPAGAVDRVYIDDRHIVAEGQGTLVFELNDTSVFDLLFDNLKGGRYHYVRAFRYDSGDNLIDSTTSEPCLTYLSELPVTGPNHDFSDSDFQSAASLKDAFVQGESTLNWPPYIAPYASGGAMVLEDQGPFSWPYGAAGHISKRCFELTPPFSFEYSFKFDLYNGGAPAFGCSLFNSEAWYGGIYFAPYGYDNSKLVIQLYSAWAHDDNGIYTGNVHTYDEYNAKGLPIPLLSGADTWHTAKIVVDADGTTHHYVNGAEKLTQGDWQFRGFKGPIFVWLQDGIHHNIQYKDIKIQGGSKYVAGLFDVANTRLIDPDQAPGGWESINYWREFDSRTVRCLTQKSNSTYWDDYFNANPNDVELDFYTEMHDNEATYPHLYTVGDFGGNLPKVVIPENLTPNTLSLWGRQKAGYLKIRVYDADTDQLVPDEELPGNTAGFTPDGVDAATSSYTPTEIDVSGVTASSIYLALDGNYDGSNLAPIVAPIDFYPSALFGASISLDGSAASAHILDGQGNAGGTIMPPSGGQTVVIM